MATFYICSTQIVPIVAFLLLHRLGGEAKRGTVSEQRPVGGRAGLWPLPMVIAALGPKRDEARFAGGVCEPNPSVTLVTFLSAISPVRGPSPPTEAASKSGLTPL